jgi:hypothetical protein
VAVDGTKESAALAGSNPLPVILLRKMFNGSLPGLLEGVIEGIQASQFHYNTIKGIKPFVVTEMPALQGAAV